MNKIIKNAGAVKNKYLTIGLNTVIV